MTRSIKPPHGIEIPTDMLYDVGLPPDLLVTWAQLRGLAWGAQETPPISFEQLKELTGKSRSTLYGHMGSLKHRGRLSWRPVGASTFIVSFKDDPAGDGVQQAGLSSKLDSPSSLSLPNPRATRSAESNNNKKIPRVQQAGQSSLLDSPPKSATRDIQAAYVELLGVEPGGWSAGEGAAAKWIGERYTVEQLIEIYAHFKRDPFWAGKRLTLRYLKTQIGSYFVDKRAGRLPAARQTIFKDVTE